MCGKLALYSRRRLSARPDFRHARIEVTQARRPVRGVLLGGYTHQHVTLKASCRLGYTVVKILYMLTIPSVCEALFRRLVWKYVIQYVCVLSDSTPGYRATLIGLSISTCPIPVPLLGSRVVRSEPPHVASRSVCPSTSFHLLISARSHLRRIPLPMYTS